MKVAAFVGSAHAVDTNLGQGFKCHITCAHYCLADVVQAVVAVKYDIFRGNRCDTFRVVGKTKKVLEIISKFYNYRCSKDRLDNEVGGTSRVRTLLLYQGCSVQGARLAGRWYALLEFRQSHHQLCWHKLALMLDLHLVGSKYGLIHLRGDSLCHISSVALEGGPP